MSKQIGDFALKWAGAGFFAFFGYQLAAFVLGEVVSRV